MSERYTRLYTLNENIYADGAPIIVSAGALLKDTITGNILAQLKLRNFSKKTIKAVKVEIIPYDTAGKDLGDPVEHQYLDLNAYPDTEFGSKCAAKLPDVTTRKFDVRVTRVIFVDNSEWVSDDNIEWSPIIYSAQSLESLLGSSDLADEYRIKYGRKCKYEPQRLRDLWVCSCGHINHESDRSCSDCNAILASMLAFDIDALNASCQSRLEAHRVAAEAKAAEEAEKQRKNKIIAAIAIPLALILLFIIIWNATATDRVLAKAEKLYNEGQLTEAYDVLKDYGKPEETKAFAYTVTKRMANHIETSINNRQYAHALTYIKMYEGYIYTDQYLVKLQAKCPHKYTITKDEAATCTKNGIQTQVCSVCEHTDSSVRYALGHDLNSTVTKKATCTDAGLRTTECSRCDVTSTESIDMLPHDMASKVTREATCTEKGEKTLTCRVCKTVKKEDIPTIAHSYKDKIIKAATCTATGTKQSECTVCKKTEKEVTIPKIDHKYKYVATKKADCTNGGTGKYVCSACNHSYKSDVAALGHSWKNATCTKAKTCTRCNKTSGSALGHNWGTGKNVSCNRCKIKYSDTITVTSNAPITLKYGSGSYTEYINITGISYYVTKYGENLRLYINYKGYVTTEKFLTNFTFIDAKLFDGNGNKLKKVASTDTEIPSYNEETGKLSESSTIACDISPNMKSFRLVFSDYE